MYKGTVHTSINWSAILWEAVDLNCTRRRKLGLWREKKIVKIACPCKTFSRKLKFLLLIFRQTNIQNLFNVCREWFKFKLSLSWGRGCNCHSPFISLFLVLKGLKNLWVFAVHISSGCACVSVCASVFNKCGNGDCILCGNSSCCHALNVQSNRVCPSRQ